MQRKSLPNTEGGMRVSGFSNEVKESADGLIYRRAITAEARVAILQQRRFLPWLATKMPYPVPVPIDLHSDVLVYRKLRGVPLTPELLPRLGAGRIAAQLAHFIRVLRSLGVEECVAAGVSCFDRTATLLAAVDRSLPFLSERYREQVTLWRLRRSAPETPPVLIHGDLWHGNILVDVEKRRISGVVDWDTAGIGDRAWDVTTQRHLGYAFARLVAKGLQKEEPELPEHGRFLFQLRCFEGLDLAIRRGDQAEFAESLRKLEESGVLT